MANSETANPDGQPGIKLSGNLANKAGLQAIHSSLCDDPSTVRYAVIRFDVQRRWLDTDTGEISPILRIKEWEPLAGDLASAGSALFDQAKATRTGQFQLEGADA